MIKTLSIAAFAFASISAFAQSDSWSTTSTSSWSSQQKMDCMDASQPISAKRQMVIKEARKWLNGGDAYEFLALMDRAPTSVDLALTEGLFNAHRTALILKSEKMASMAPGYSTTFTMTNNDGSITTTTTSYTVDEWNPVRKSMMEEPNTPKHIDYDRGLQILIDGQDETQAHILSDWWRDMASEKQKDVVVRLLAKSIRSANAPMYASVLSIRTPMVMSQP